METAAILVILVLGLAGGAFALMGFLSGKSTNPDVVWAWPYALAVGIGVTSAELLVKDFAMAAVLGVWVLGLLIGRFMRPASKS